MREKKYSQKHFSGGHGGARTGAIFTETFSAGAQNFHGGAIFTPPTDGLHTSPPMPPTLAALVLSNAARFDPAQRWSVALPPSAAGAIRFEPSETLLNESLVLRSFENPVWRDERFACLLSRLRAGRPVSVAVLGGSISAGSVFGVQRGAKGDWLYHAKVAKALQTIFPTARATGGNGSVHRLHNGALPATGPAWFEHCVESQLPLARDGTVAADLIVVEFAVNTDGQPAAFERMLRKLLALRRRRSLPAVLVLNLHVWNRAEIRAGGSGRVQPRMCFHIQRSAPPPPPPVTNGKPRPPARPRKVANPLTVEQSADWIQRRVQTWEDTFNYGDEDVRAMRAACTNTGGIGRCKSATRRRRRGACLHTRLLPASSAAALAGPSVARDPRGARRSSLGCAGTTTCRSSRCEAPCCRRCATMRLRRLASPTLCTTVSTPRRRGTRTWRRWSSAASSPPRARPARESHIRSRAAQTEPAFEIPATDAAHSRRNLEDLNWAARAFSGNGRNRRCVAGAHAPRVGRFSCKMRRRSCPRRPRTLAGRSPRRAARAGCSCASTCTRRRALR